MKIQTPDWVKNAVFYQIFPDRFAKSSRIQHPSGLKFKPWGTPPEEQGFQGGDLYGKAVNLAARLCAHSEPEQILVAEIVRDQCKEQLFSFIDMGEIQFKGFTEPTKVHEVQWQAN